MQVQILRLEMRYGSRARANFASGHGVETRLTQKQTWLCKSRGGSRSVADVHVQILRVDTVASVCARANFAFGGEAWVMCTCKFCVWK